jgi:hypothetical protein
VLDEIHRLVPGYQELSRMTLASGGDQHLQWPANPELAKMDMSSHAALVLPSGDGLMDSGTLGRYCDLLKDVDAHESKQSPETVVDVRA